MAAAAVGTYGMKKPVTAVLDTEAALNTIKMDCAAQTWAKNAITVRATRL